MKYISALLVTIIFSQISFAQETWLDKIIEKNNQDSLQQEINNGEKPAAHKHLGEWSPFFRQDMNEIWQSIGIKGVNYYCVGGPEQNNQYIERNDFKSKYYQAWLGIYVIEAKNKLFCYPNDSLNSTSYENIKNLLSIGVLDQTSWLFAMGDTSAANSTSIIEPGGRFPIVEKIFIDGQYAPVIEFEMKSHSDLTDKTSDMTSVFAMPNKEYWQKQLRANHSLTLKGFYIYWYNKTKQTLKIIYGTGCSFRTSDKVNHNTYPLLKKEMLDIARSIKFIDVR
ncbi:MAG TPA: hypothetical protein VHD35_13095 [Chitinophagaceae bacterium]|nr:hypothetical protein [Chitinophagaceae bacterium]